MLALDAPGGAYLQTHELVRLVRSITSDAARTSLVMLAAAATLRRILTTGPGKRLARIGNTAAASAEGGFHIGVTREGGRGVSVPARHTVVVGATGVGKTVTIRRILSQASADMGLIAIDGKGDPELERDLERLARATGRRFQAWSPEHTTRYSPFCHGSDTEIVDKALAAERWGDDYYLRLGQRFLGFAVRGLRAAGSEPTLRDLAHYVDPANLEELAPAMERAAPGSWGDLIATLPALDRAERQAIGGTQHRLATLAESDLGALLEAAPGCELVDLLEVVRAGNVAYFNLNADARPALSRMVGAAIVMDLVSIAATLQRNEEYLPTVLMLDDVQAFLSAPALAGIASLFARGRSAGMMLLVGTQSLADFNLGGSPGGIDQLLDNRSTLIVHRLPGHGSASRGSRELGEREDARLSEQLEAGVLGWHNAGRVTRTMSMEPNVMAAELMDLETGVAVVKTSERPPDFVRISLPH
jgi:Cdc6-like AAA superfamily ATPase